jgi:hypothetical protein
MKEENFIQHRRKPLLDEEHQSQLDERVLREWNFNEDTWLENQPQIDPKNPYDSSNNDWILTHSKEDVPNSYSIKVGPNRRDICEVIIHVCEKTWVNPEKVLMAMLPAIRAAAYTLKK